MNGLTAPKTRFIGTFRGEPDLENVQVRTGSQYGMVAVEVADELARFETKLRALVQELDSILPANSEPNADQLAAFLDLCAWAHAE
jgi:hypothetical protein